MTVKRTKTITFAKTLKEVTAAVRSVLQNTDYKKTTEENENVFKTVVKTNPFLLGTNMIINIYCTKQQTEVTIKIESQELIFGDMFNFYNKFIDTFSERLSKKLL